MKRTSLVATLAAVAALALAGCGGDDDNPLEQGDGSSDTVRVGSANFPESVVLAEIYAGALEAKGLKVNKTLNIGSRESYIKAMTDTKNPGLDVFPEYTGNLRLYFNESATASTPDDVYAELEDALPDTLVVLDKAEAEDKDSVAVTADTAEKYSLKSIGDLKPVAKDMTLGGPPEWKTRQTGVPGLKAKYDVVFGKFRALDAGGKLTLDAILNGTVDAGNMFTTDPNVASGKLVALEDPESLFAAQNVVPLVRKDVLTDDIESALNDVSAALSQQALLDLVDAVTTQQKDPEDVAADFLAQNNLD